MQKKSQKDIVFSDSITPTLRDMEVGDVAYYPITRLKVVCATAYDLGAIMRRKYKTQRYPSLGYMQVIRLT